MARPSFFHPAAYYLFDDASSVRNPNLSSRNGSSVSARAHHITKHQDNDNDDERFVFHEHDPNVDHLPELLWCDSRACGY